MRMHRIAIVVVTVALGSAIIGTGAVAAGGNAGGHGGGGMGGGHFSGAMGGSHFGGGVGRGFGGGRFAGAMGGGRIGGDLRGGHFDGGRFAGRFERSHRVRGLVVPFGYYDDWYSGDGYYDPSTVTPDEQPNYPTTDYTYVKPRSSCSTQTYKVPSEGGGKASVNVVRC